ncbi:MAG: hypothetical protein KIY09_06770 [Thermoplasmata archaeon]|nr:hypothetical protein [Candidatus Sysuiplasma acidicola]
MRKGKSGESLQEKIRQLEEKKEHYSKMLDEMESTGEHEISLTDPDCRAVGCNGVPGMNGGQKVKVLYGVAAATVSRTARVSVARLNLKEAAGKVPARRTETVYEAVSRPDKLAIQSEVQQLHRSACVYAAGIWDEGIRSYPGRSGIMQQHVKRAGVSSVQTCCRKQFSDELLRCQKSAEPIVRSLRKG